MDDWTEDDVFERFGKPRTGKLVGRPGSEADGSIPRYVVEPAEMPDAKYLKHEILLSDFGEAFPFGQPSRPKDIGIPFTYRVPETMFDSKLDLSSEVWSLACVLFEIRAGNPLFTNIMGKPRRDPPTDGADEGKAARSMVGVLGTKIHVF
jgi:serine/threonine-protein kinase SRPK3